MVGVQHVMGPWTTGGVYLNFAERPKTGKALFGSYGTLRGFARPRRRTTLPT